VSPHGDSFVLAGDAGLSVALTHGRSIHVSIPDVMDVAFSPDGSRLAVVTFEGRLRLVSTRTWRTSSPIVKVDSGSLLAVTFADGGRLVVGSGSAGIQLWRAGDLAAVAPPLEGGDGPVDALAAAPQGDTLVAGTTLGIVHLWNLAIAAPEQPAVPATLPETNSVVVSPDGSLLAAGHTGGTVEVLDASTGRRIQLLHTDMHVVEAVDFDPAGQLLTVGGGAESLLGRHGAAVEQWAHHGSWHHVRTVDASGPRVTSVDVSPTGQYVAAASEDGSVREWDGSLGKLIWARRSRTDSPVQRGEVTFDAGGRTLAAGDWQGNVQLIDPGSGRTRGSFNQPDGYIDSFSFAPDDRRLAVGSSDGRVQVWDTRTRRTVGTPIDTGGVAAMSRDGGEIFTADSSGIHVWDAATHQQVGQPLIGSDEPITTLALTPDGNTLVTGYADGAVSRWDISYLADPVHRLCSRPGATYGDSDWHANVPAGPSPRPLCP
jgi:WD40 repeat protein